MWVNKDSGKFTFPFFEALDSYWPGLLVSYNARLLIGTTYTLVVDITMCISLYNVILDIKPEISCFLFIEYCW